MKKFLKKVLKNKKEIITLILFFFLSFSIPLTGYFVTSERSFDERGRASTLGPAKVISFSISPPSQVQGGDVTVSGKTEGATECRFGPSSSEYEQLTDRYLNTSFSITRPLKDTSPGTYTYTLACNNNTDDTSDFKTATLTVTASSGTPPPPSGGTPPPPSGDSCSSLGGTCSWTYIISGRRCTTGGKTGTVKMGLCPNDQGCCVPNTTTQPTPPPSPTVKYSRSSSVCGADGRYPCVEDANGSYTTLSGCQSSCPPPSSPPPSPTVKYSRSSSVCGADGRYPCVEDANGSYTTLSGCQSSCPPPSSPPPSVPIVGECTTNLDCRRQAPFEICFSNMCLRGDVLNNSMLNMVDFSEFKKDFITFKQSGWSEVLRRSDFNLDGRISMADYSVFVRSYRLINRLD